MRKFDGLRPGTMRPSPMSAPEPSHTGMLGGTVTLAELATSMRTMMPTADPTRMPQSRRLRPRLPACLNREGKVPMTKPMNSTMNCAAYVSNAASTALAKTTTPSMPPMPTGMK